MDYKIPYIDFLKKFIVPKRPLNVVLDASNGPAGMIVKELWSGTSVKTITINDNVDPNFSAHGPNPLAEGAAEDCRREILANKADLGVIFDADGDRAIFLDDTGAIIPACFVAALLFREAKPPYVADELVYQSLKLLKIFPENQVVPSRVGSRFLKEEIKKADASAAAEFSGHYYFKDFFGADSGIFAAIVVINSLSKISEPLSSWRNQFGEHQIVSKEIKTVGKEITAQIMDEIYSQAERTFSSTTSPHSTHSTSSALNNVESRDGRTFVFDTCWVNARSSNTEPLIRLIGGGTTDVLKKVEVLEGVIFAGL